MTFVVAVAPDQSLNVVSERLQALGYTVRRQIDDIHALDVSGRDDDASVQRAEAVEGVRYAEHARAVAAVDTPSDPLFGNEYPYLQAVGAPGAWDITTGTPNIVVAVVDTGVAIQHVDLQQNIWVNLGEIANNGTDDDGNGCVDDVNGCAYVSDSSPGCSNVTIGFVNDDIGHGTFVSGVIAAAANNVGIVGVARHVRIMPVKVLDCHGEGDTVATARGIVYAARNGARAIGIRDRWRVVAPKKGPQLRRDSPRSLPTGGASAEAASPVAF